MKENNRSRHRGHSARNRAVAAIGALALGILGGVAIAAPASAIEPEPSRTVGPNIPDERGSITVHKYEQPSSATGLPHDGSEIPSADLAGLTPLSGVTFTVELVTGPAAGQPGSIDLDTNEGWETLQTLTPADIVAPTYTKTLVDTGVTDAAGEVEFSDLPVGVYLVTETNPGANSIVSTATPFLVSVPLPNDGSWNFDIHAYPKNAVADAPEKAVEDEGAYALGDEVTWTISSTVPAFAASTDLTKYVITDDLDDRLDYASATVSLTGSGGANVPLVPADYTLTAVDGLVTVTFTADGRLKLFNNPGGIVKVEIVTEVIAVGDGTIENKGFVNVNDKSQETNQVVTTWVPVTVTKVDSESEKPLKGAVFEVYTSETGGTPLSILGTTQFPTDAQGQFTIPGLKAGEVYWLQEVTAPEGYYALDTRIRIPATGELTLTGAKEGVAIPYELEVENTPIPDWALPLTGSNGSVLFGTAGTALIAIAAGTAFVLARRKAATA